MKKLLLILLCLPIIGFGQDNSTLEHSIIDTVFCSSFGWGEMYEEWEYLEFKSLTTIRDSFHYDIEGVNEDVKIQSEIESTTISFDDIGLSNFDYNDGYYALDQICIIKYTVKKYKRTDYPGEGIAFSDVIVFGNILIELKLLDLDKVNPRIKEKLLKNKRELKQKEQALVKKKLTKSTKDSLEIVYAVLSKCSAKEDANKILVERELQELLIKHKDEINNANKKYQKLEFKYMIMTHNNIKENAKLFIIESLESNLVTTEDLKEMLSKYSDKEIKLKNIKAYMEELFEKNKSDNEFVGKWYVSVKMIHKQRENPYFLIKDDGTIVSSDKPFRDITWSVKGNIFYLQYEEDMMSCYFNKEKTKLECDFNGEIIVLEK